jgi:hypothetical protein
MYLLLILINELIEYLNVPYMHTHVHMYINLCTHIYINELIINVYIVSTYHVPRIPRYCDIVPRIHESRESAIYYEDYR